MSLFQQLALAAKLEPYAEGIKEAAALAKEIEADPRVKEALELVEKYLNDPRLSKALETVKAVSTVMQESQNA